MLGKPCIRLNNLKTSLRFPCHCLNPIIDSVDLAGVLSVCLTVLTKKLYIDARAWLFKTNDFVS